jgi:hypothetical protein
LLPNRIFGLSTMLPNALPSVDTSVVVPDVTVYRCPFSPTPTSFAPDVKFAYAVATAYDALVIAGPAYEVPPRLNSIPGCDTSAFTQSHRLLFGIAERGASRTMPRCQSAATDSMNPAIYR